MAKAKMRRLKFWGLGLLASLSASAFAKVEISGRHIFMLQAAEDIVWGSYIFLVNNDGETAETVDFPLILPKETVDWAAQEGLASEDLALGPEKGVHLKKAVEPGEKLMVVGFKLPAIGGSAPLSVETTNELGRLVIMVRKDSGLKLDAPGFERVEDLDLRESLYESFGRGPIAPQERLQVKISGVPEGRARLWQIGFGTFALLLVSAFGLAYRQRVAIPN